MSTTTTTAQTSTDLRHDYEYLARCANLRYVSDEEPGYTRRRWGRGFSYRDFNGNTVKDKALRARFDGLGIPPMWSQVWICQHEDGHLQSTGRDDKARKQYLYHPDWESARDKAKFDAMIGFGHGLPSLRAQVERDLEEVALSRANVLAAVVKLLETTLIRVGNSRYAKQNKSYGLSTLRSKHLSETEDGLAFDFVGKSAKQHHIELQDERLIEIVNACSELPGYQIFKYLDEGGDKQVVDSSDINDYVREHLDCETGVLYSAKDFRTWMASVLAADYLYHACQGNLPTEQNPIDEKVVPPASSDILASEPDSKLRQQVVVDMVKSVSTALGNTPAVCRTSYIHPVIIESFLAGEFYEPYKNARRGRTRNHQQCEEKALLSFLEDMAAQ